MTIEVRPQINKPLVLDEEWIATQARAELLLHLQHTTLGIAASDDELGEMVNKIIAPVTDEQGNTVRYVQDSNAARDAATTLLGRAELSGWTAQSDLHDLDMHSFEIYAKWKYVAENRAWHDAGFMSRPPSFTLTTSTWGHILELLELPNEPRALEMYNKAADAVEHPHDGISINTGHVLHTCRDLARWAVDNHVEMIEAV